MPSESTPPIEKASRVPPTAVIQPANSPPSGAKTVTGGLIFTLERNKVMSLGDTSRKFINTAYVNGQGQSNQFTQRIMPGQPLGTFWGPQFFGFGGGLVTIFESTENFL